MSAQNPFPSRANLQGYQTIASTCSETDSIRLYNGNLLKTVTVVDVPTVGLGFKFILKYNSLMSTATASPVGNKWRHNYMRSLAFSGMPVSLVTYTDPSGRQFNFVPSGANWVPSGTSFYTPGTLVENSTNWQITYPDGSAHTFDTNGNLIASSDAEGNLTSFQYSGSVLVSITEPTGRAISLAYTGSFITSVTDPNGNQTTLVYDTTHSNLTKIMGPTGCTIQYGYTTPSNSLITSRTDPNGNIYTYGYNGSSQLTSVTDAESPSNSIGYAYDTVLENVDDNSPPATQSFSRTTLTDAFSNPWEFHFDQTGLLWRTIEPVDSGVTHWRRFYWDSNQQFLYASGGYPRPALGRAGPKESTNNSFRRRVNDGTIAKPLYHADASGKMSAYTYNSAHQMTSSYAGQGHLGVQGNWVGQYGGDGYLLCAFDSTSADVQSLPGYISTVSMGTATRQRLDNSTNYTLLIDPRTPMHPTTLHKGNGYWQSSSAFTMTFNLTSATTKRFNLSLYSNSTDEGFNQVNPSVQYQEQSGRDVTYTVTDLNGTRTYRVTNNAMGQWVTFPVSGNSSTAVTVQIAPTGANALATTPDVRVSAIMFDPYDNHQATYGYDTSHNLTSVTDGLGNTASAVYNPNGTIASTTDQNGHTTLFFYEDAHLNLTRIRDAAGFDTRMTYDANSNVLTKTDANGHVTTMTYDGKNRVLTVTNGLGYTSSIQYDSAGNVSITTDANGNQTQYFYTPTNRLKKVTDAASESTQYAYDAGGNLHTVTDPNSNVTTLSYDQSNRLTQTTRADGSIVSQSWDTNNHLVATTTPNGNQSTVSNINLTGAANFLWNPGFETVFAQTPTAALGWRGQAGAVVSVSTTVSHSGQNSLKIQATGSGADAVQAFPVFPAGGRGLASVWARPDGSTNSSTAFATLTMYKADGSLDTPFSFLTLPTSSTSWAQIPLFRFDVPGYSQYVQSPLKNFKLTASATGLPNVWFDDAAMYSLSTGMQYDNEGRLLSTQMPDGSLRQYGYDRYGRLIQMVDPKMGLTQMAYDSLGRVTSVTDALGNVTQYAYDAVGNRTQVTDPNSNVTSYAYDQKNQLVSITYPDLTTELFAYDPVGNVVQYTNNNGQVFTMTYDAANRLVQRLYHTDSSTVQYGYDLVGNLVTRMERNGDLCWYNYDVVNRLVGVERNPSPGTFSSTSSWLQRHVYDAAGTRTELDNGTAATAGVYGTATYGTATLAVPPVQWTVPTGGYDDMNRMTKYNDAGSNQTTLSYDVEGRVSGITYPNGTPKVTATPTYDIISRLVTNPVAQGATSILPLQFGYDASGNRLAVVTGADTFYYDVDAANRLVQEDINRIVERSLDRFQQGMVAGVDVTSGSLNLIAVNDTFTGTVMDLDRWQTNYTIKNIVSGIEIRQNGALLMTSPRGFTSTLAAFGALADTTPPINQFALIANMWGGVQHRVALPGDFDIQVSFNDFQGYQTGANNAALALIATDTSLADVLDNGGNSKIIIEINSIPQYSSTIVNSGGTPTNNTITTSDTSGKLRLVRSGTTVTTYYWGSGAWQSLGTMTSYSTSTMFVGLAIVTGSSRGFVSTSLSTFQSNLSAGQYPTTGTYTSSVYDAGRSVTWNSIQWNATVPTGATLEYQIATSSSSTGPFTFVGPDGTSATFFTTSGTSIHTGTTGRYVQYQATLGGNGSVTPTVSRVDLLFSGANTSTEIAYSYDGSGNMVGKVTEVSGSSTVTETRTVNSLNQITANSVVGSSTTNWSFTFDSNGNMKTRTNTTLSQTTTYSWDEDNRLTQVLLPSGTTVSYSYDILGRMLARTDSSGTTVFVWDGMDCIEETDPSGSVTRYYVVNGVLMSFDRTVSGTISVYQVHADALGSVRKVTNSSGSVVATYDFDAWGNQLASTSDSVPNGGFMYRFVGALGVRWDADTGLYYMRQRWYDPQLQRFIGRDVLRTNNRYTYALNHPQVLSDSTGADPSGDNGGGGGSSWDGNQSPAGDIWGNPITVNRLAQGLMKSHQQPCTGPDYNSCLYNCLKKNGITAAGLLLVSAATARVAWASSVVYQDILDNPQVDYYIIKQGTSLAGADWASGQSPMLTPPSAAASGYVVYSVTVARTAALRQAATMGYVSALIAAGALAGAGAIFLSCQNDCANDVHTYG